MNPPNFLLNHHESPTNHQLNIEMLALTFNAPGFSREERAMAKAKAKKAKIATTMPG